MHLYLSFLFSVSLLLCNTRNDTLTQRGAPEAGTFLVEMSKLYRNVYNLTYMRVEQMQQKLLIGPHIPLLIKCPMTQKILG